eukprot:3309935-Amphidinium_carterae.7
MATAGRNNLPNNRTQNPNAPGRRIRGGTSPGWEGSREVTHCVPKWPRKKPSQRVTANTTYDPRQVLGIVAVAGSIQQATLALGEKPTTMTHLHRLATRYQFQTSADISIIMPFL